MKVRLARWIFALTILFTLAAVCTPAEAQVNQDRHARRHSYHRRSRHRRYDRRSDRRDNRR